MELQKLGSNSGGWWVPIDILRPGSRAYCAGAGEDITFDLALLDAGLEVATFDPTPRAIEHVAGSVVAPTADFTFVPEGWWDKTSTLRFYSPRNPLDVSHSITNLQGTAEYFEAPVRSVADHARRLGHHRVDLIKMDIEGAEHRVINSLLRDGPRPQVLCVEFDQPVLFRRVAQSIRLLQRSGFKFVKMSKWDCTFIR